MKKMIHTLLIFALTLSFFGYNIDSTSELDLVNPVEESPEAPLEVGYSLSINQFTPEILAAAKAAGVEHVEASARPFIDGNANLRMSREEAIVKLTEAKKNADAAGINIWSIHMPFGQHVDISVRDEANRQKTVTAHIWLVELLEILEPEIILFHPSWYLGLNERDERKAQLRESAVELDEAVRAIGSKMVLENMLGPELLLSSGRHERPLMRTVEESKEIFSRLPATIGLAVDTNHIIKPEILIRAMGNKLETVHIADGTGRAENHFFPCTGEGKNDWNAILSALDEVGYDGPFMFESKGSDVSQYRKCYESLYRDWFNQK